MSDVLDITLMGREFRVASAPEERESLLAAVAYVDRKMHELAAQTRVSGERLVVLAALNLAHELLHIQLGGESGAGPYKERIGALRTRIEEELARQETLF